MKKQRKALTSKETVIAMYCPFEVFRGLQFRWLLRQVLKEAGSEKKLSDYKLTAFQEKYTPLYGRIEFNTWTGFQSGYFSIKRGSWKV